MALASTWIQQNISAIHFFTRTPMRFGAYFFSPTCHVTTSGGGRFGKRQADPRQNQTCRARELRAILKRSKTERARATRACLDALMASAGLWKVRPPHRTHRTPSLSVAWIGGCDTRTHLVKVYTHRGQPLWCRRNHVSPPAMPRFYEDQLITPDD